MESIPMVIKLPYQFDAQTIISRMKTSKILLLCAVFSTTTAQAEDTNYPKVNDVDEFSLMGTLADLGWHDIVSE